ncbi:MAG: phage major capsid protein [Rhodocyclales bacterium GT-UBC]|nr:MAG: phage major capsid protein [Rhodocyclales bacterium GT-UBC]
MSLHQEVIKSLGDIEGRINQSFEGVLAKQREQDDRIFGLEQKGSAGHFETSETKGPSFGKQVVEGVKRNHDLLSKTDRLRLEIKAASDVTTTSSARSVISGGVGAPAGMLLGGQFAFPSRVIGAVSSYEYSRYTGIEGGAAKQSAEGAAKSAVRPTFSLVNQPAITVAGYSKVSKQALTDSEELMRAIDVTLRRSINTTLDSELNGGSWGGLLTLATAYTSLLYTSLADAASEAVAVMQEAGFNPDTVIMRPADWLSITVAKSTTGEYLSGSYLSPLPEGLRGLKVVLSPTITAGKVLVVDSSQIELLIVDDLIVEIGTDADDFTKNVRTILGEMRVIPTFRAVGAARLITPKAP